MRKNYKTIMNAEIEKAFEEGGFSLY